MKIYTCIHMFDKMSLDGLDIFMARSPARSATVMTRLRQSP